MKTIHINLQTSIFLNDNDFVIGAYNKNSNVLAYNKPHLIAGELEEMSELGNDETQLFKTDSFGINFYSHSHGDTRVFHEVKKKR